MLEGSLGAIIFFLVFIIGYIVLYFSKKQKLPAPIILFIIGLFLQLFIKDVDIMPFVVVSLVFLLFDAGSRFIPRKFNNNSIMIAEFVIYSILLNVFFFGLILHFLFFRQLTLYSALLSILFGCLITACSQFEILEFFKVKKNRLYNITELEDHISNPIVMIISVLVLFCLSYLSSNTVSRALALVLGSFFMDIAVGVFFGLIILYIAVRILKRKYTSVVAIVLSLLTYFVAVHYKGTGFIAVMIASLFFHNIVSKKPDMAEFNIYIDDAIYVFVFISMGYIVYMCSKVFLASIFFFLLYLAIRKFLLMFFVKETGEAASFMTLDCPKGLLAGAFVVYALLIYTASYYQTLIFLLSNLILMFIYSIVLSYCVNILTKDIIK